MPEIIMCYLVEQSFKFIYKVLLLYVKHLNDICRDNCQMRLNMPKSGASQFCTLFDSFRTNLFFLWRDSVFRQEREFEREFQREFGI